MTGQPTCPRCGGPMSGGTAILCFGGGEAQTLPLSLACESTACRHADQKERDDAAISWAIERGIIDP